MALFEKHGMSKTPEYIAWSGAKGRDMASYKYLKLQDKAVTAKEYQKAQEKWNKERAESNKKAQEELEKHVK